MSHTDHPSHKRLLGANEHKDARRLYLIEMRGPKEIAGALNAKYGTSFTATQLNTYVKARGWSTRRKRDAERAAVLADSRLGVQKQSAELVAKHKDFTDAAARVGAKVLQKAETFVERAADAKTLVAAANAARTGAEIYRKAVGLDSGEGSVLRVGTINLNYAHSEESPFARVKREMKPVEPLVVEATLEADGDEDDDGVGHELSEGDVVAV